MKRAKPKKTRKAKSTRLISRDKVRSLAPTNTSAPEAPPLEVVLPRNIKGKSLLIPTTESIPPIQPPAQETDVAAAEAPEVTPTEAEAAPPQPALMVTERVTPTPTFERGRQLFANFRQPLILGGLVFILTLASLSGVFYILQKFAPTAVPNVSPAPVLPTPEPVFDRSAWIFEVLNGSGKAGEAAKAAKLLRELGYLVLNISNAASPSAQTQLFVSEASLAEAKLLIKDLEEDFAIASLSGMLLVDGESTATARLVIGKNQE